MPQILNKLNKCSFEGDEPDADGELKVNRSANLGWIGWITDLSLIYFGDSLDSGCESGANPKKSRESRFILDESGVDSDESEGAPREDSRILWTSLWITARNATLAQMKCEIFVKI